MSKILVFLVILSCSFALRASWYWPFGSDEKEPPRLSELMELASLLIDEASDLASEGKVSEAVEKYRAALVELDRVEAENPDRVERPEFATLKTKRAYVGAAIDSLLLNQARANAKTVAVSDTTALERKLAAERGEKKVESEVGVGELKGKVEVEERRDSLVSEELPRAKKVVKQKVRKATKPKAKKAPPRPLTKSETVMKAISEKDFATADRLIEELLAEKPNGAAVLNLRAARESAAGDFKAAEKTLDQAIQSNPRDYFAYYNMAQLYLQANPDNKSGARRYYETARAYGCPEDAELEAALK